MKTYAFFDVDGTIVNMTTMISFLRYVQKHHPQPQPLGRSWSTLQWRIGKRFLSRELVNRLYYRIFAGFHVDAITALGARWFEELLAQNAIGFNAPVLAILRRHQAANHEVVFVSGSFHPCLAPLARYLNVHQMLCVKPHIRQGLFTGEIGSPQTIGQGKADAIVQHLFNEGSTLDNCLYAYGDHLSDLPMLNLARYPTAVIGDPALQQHATRHHWRILSGEKHADEEFDSIEQPEAEGDRPRHRPQRAQAAKQPAIDAPRFWQG